MKITGRIWNAAVALALPVAEKPKEPLPEPDHEYVPTRAEEEAAKYRQDRINYGSNVPVWDDWSK